MSSTPMVTTGLIGGSSIVRSLSPAMHNAAFAFYGLDECYALWPTEASALAGRVVALREGRLRGANVTIPHKAAVLPLVDVLGEEPDVRALDACNTIVRHDDGTLLGLNTDVPGFLRALGAAGFDPRGADVVLLGAGGAARAVAWGLAHAGIRSLAVANRSIAPAEALLALLRRYAPAPRATAIAPESPDLASAMGRATLLVNATPIGADDQASPIPLDLLHPDLFVSDLLYRSTPLLRAAIERGARGQDGLEMLVQQGALAFEAWANRPAPVDDMRQAAQATRDGEMKGPS